MEYLTGPGKEGRNPIDGGIVQAPVSDREALFALMGEEKYKETCAAAQKFIDEGLEDDILPSRLSPGALKAPMSAKRWLSLASPNHDGDDDYFSSDLSDAQLAKSFGSLPKGSPICVLMSGSDEYVPPTIEKKVLFERWIEAAKKGEGKVVEEFSGIVEGASHNLSGNEEKVVGDLVKRVIGFLESRTKE